MKRLLVLFSCVLLLLAVMPSKTKALTEEEKQRAMRRDIERGLLAIEPPVKDDIAVASDTDIKMAKAEEDRDHLHHARGHDQQNLPRQKLRMQAQQVLEGPEEDRDHLYHQH
ncbi:proline-rich acidic protein 1 [Phyllobates terribilis]|uniref:proline-rich acidic protein 1 n=1 Tax=Phyllobates terribilis TaxID=111132 RepID=UPI003CCAFB04